MKALLDNDTPITTRMFIYSLVENWVCDAVHLALVQANINEFNASGFDGMTQLVDNYNSHDIYLWWGE